MTNELLKVAIRKNKIFIPQKWIQGSKSLSMDETTIALAANCSKLGFVFSESLLRQINCIGPFAKLQILESLKEVTGVKKNWTPLVKQWDIPTGESFMDHVITSFVNLFKLDDKPSLPCGHVIPKNTFPLERYNGCPFCGTPFEFDELDYEPIFSKMKTLDLVTEVDLKNDLNSLLASPVALDATQLDTLKNLIAAFGVPPAAQIKMKESLMVVIDYYVDSNQSQKVGKYFVGPNDILRYLWYKHTGYVQLIEPKTILRLKKFNSTNMISALDKSNEAKNKAKDLLKLKFTRSQCKQYAKWINDLEMDITKQCETMHPKRSMWVRVIRALRLAEYSKRKEFSNLKQMLDVFYNEDYQVWQGQVQRNKLKLDYIQTFSLLKQRPSLFARSLFSTMLWFGPDLTIKHFKEIIHKVPQRLIFTLNMYADIYFDKTANRVVKTLSGMSKKIPANKLLQLFSDAELNRMQLMIRDLSLAVIKSNLELQTTESKSIYIDKGLYNIPISIGDRSNHIQDREAALMGTRFKVEGDKVRLFLQWGVGLPAQHLDMDLSCKVTYLKKEEICSFSNLVTTGCKHSGDIQKIPHMVGAAEYIDLDLKALQKAGAQYVSFTCNAYTNGSLSPNLVLGWMNSKFPMKVNASGVAYNPTALQHQVRIKDSLTKGILFGVLHVATREIIWLELGFGGQVTQNLNMQAVEGMLKKLDAKLKIGDLLALKAACQGLQILEDAYQADEVYDMAWAMDTAQVSSLFLETAKPESLAE